nr:retrotransposon protein, putative, Ty1-copia subclass [Tanacetum cinerariifolium]
NYNMHSLGKKINELHAMLKLHEQTLPKNNTPALLEPGLRASRKLKPVALSLYVGNGQREAVEAIYEVENQLGKTIKSLRSDRGGEYMSQEFLDHLKDHGIIAHRTPPYTPQHNGVSKRRNITLLDMVRSLTSQTTLPKSFWDYAIETAARILNMVPTKKVKKTPYEVWHGQAPKLSYLKFWGYEALVKRDTLTKPEKLEPRSIKCIFIGYPKETMGYSFYYPPENKVLVARNVEFLENSLIKQEASGSLENLEIIQEEDTHPSIDTSLNHKEDDLEIDEPQKEHELGDLGEPANYKAALLDPESKKWLNAMNEEMQSMKDNKVWVLAELPPNGKTVGSKWLFKKKTDMDGVVHTYKARLVAKGYTQILGIDYEDTFSPVADIRAIMILIAIAAYYDYEIWQMDVKTSFLNGYLNEEVYMEQPEGFVNLKYPNQRYCIENSKRGSIPMKEKLKLSKSHGASTPAELKRMQNVPYASAVGFIMYVVRCTRPDVAFAQNSVKQSIFATSSAEAEYIAAFDASNEALWVRKFIYGLGVVSTIKEPISMYCDNTGAIAIANESGITKGSRHFYAKVHYLREVIEYGDIKLEKVHTNDNLDDPFTKALAFLKHSEHTRNIRMLPAISLISKISHHPSNNDLHASGIPSFQYSPQTVLKRRYYIEKKVSQKHGDGYLLDGVKSLICMHKDKIDDIDCLRLAIGEKNAHNIISGTQQHKLPYIVRPPELQYNEADQLRVLDASPAQVTFSQKPLAERVEELAVEKRKMENCLNKYKINRTV